MVYKPTYNLGGPILSSCSNNNNKNKKTYCTFPSPPQKKRKHCSKPQSSTSFIHFNVFTCAFLCESHTLFLFTPNDSFHPSKCTSSPGCFNLYPPNPKQLLFTELFSLFFSQVCSYSWVMYVYILFMSMFNQWFL